MTSEEQPNKAISLEEALSNESFTKTAGTTSPSSSAKVSQDSSASFDLSGLSPDEIKREFDIFRDVLGNVNNTLRFQIQLSVTLLAACVTVLNIVPPQEHAALLKT